VTDRRDPLALPSVTPTRTATILAAYAYVTDAHDRHVDPRDVLKGLEAQLGAKVTYPSYRTALRCGDIYTEGAAWCALVTAGILLDSFMAKAHSYLGIAHAEVGPLPSMWRRA
jgi:hypothetical protein